jgi:hypothetical protein
VTQDKIGIATSGRQFFMQIGQVMGVAIFGLVFTTTYGSAFTKELPADTRAAIPANVITDFKDPTLTLDANRFDSAKISILALPGGQAVLDDAVKAQRDAVTTATDRIFLFALAGAIVVVGLAITLPEIPLRRTFSTPEEATEAGGVPVEVMPLELG